MEKRIILKYYNLFAINDKYNYICIRVIYK